MCASLFNIKIIQDIMSILAGPRRKQRYSIDPQNLQWKNDEELFSKKLMQKMGWKEGDGLGKNRQGESDAIKLKPNYSGKGLGADKLTSYDSTWIAHHDDFADLLTALNKNKEVLKKDEATEEVQKMSLELKSKSIRRRIHYQKFTRAKDTSNYTDNDKAAILGRGLKKVKSEADVESLNKKESNDEKVEDVGPTTVSQLSVAEYFAAKMAALKQKRDGAALEGTPKEELEEDYEEMEIKEEIKIESDEELQEETEEELRKRLKRERKLAKKQIKLEDDLVVKVEEIEVKQEKVEEEEEEEEVETEEQTMERKRLKRERKQARRLARNQESTPEGTEKAEEQKVKRHHEEDQTEEPPRKRQKKASE